VWSIYRSCPAVADLVSTFGDHHPAVRTVGFDCSALTAWDSALLVFLVELENFCEQANVKLRRDGLPSGVQRLLALYAEVPEREGVRVEEEPISWLAQVGNSVLDFLRASKSGVGFLGEICIALGRLCLGRARLRRADLAILMQEAGASALPIVTLISLLVGLILAYIGAVQLEYFGAQIFVADLVALGMTREMGATMTGVIMAGRTGASYAAELGSQRVNEEIDALTTLGIPPIDFLVLPRVLALITMLPILTLYADFLGILGGAVVGVGLMDLGPQEYLQRTLGALELRHVGAGLLKGLVYGVLIAIAGCMRGMESGKSASAVGVATTSAVVTSIVWIVVASASLTVIYSVVGV
jgi:phospholipid/cholesterol/gamma-HCH transport system permease protein